MAIARETSQIHIDRNFEMPSVPIVLTKILHLVDDNKASARRLEELILHDPSLSARILKLANSAFYSFRNEVKTISHAIALLGLNLVKSLAIGVGIFESFTKGLRDETVHVNALWMHSFAVGLGAQEIWTRRSNRVEGEFALLCGLLHDLGKVVYFKKDSRRYCKLFAMEKQETDPDISTHEFNGYGITHSVLGSMLAKQWGLPPDLASVVRQHHNPLSSNLPLVAAVSMADLLAKRYAIGHDGDNRWSAEIAGLQEMLRMEEAEFERVNLFMLEKQKEVDEFFHIGY